MASRLWARFRDGGRLASIELFAPAALLLLSLVWGTQFLVIKIGQSSLPPFLTASARFGILALVAQTIVSARGLRAPSGLASLRVVYGAAQAACMGLLYWSEASMSSSLAGLLLATTPFFVLGLAHFSIDDEPFKANTALATVFGFVGIALIAAEAAMGQSAHASLGGMIAAVLAAFFGAANKVSSKALVGRAPAPIMLRDLGVVVALGTGLMWFAVERDRPLRFSFEAVLAFTYLGLVASAAASGLYLVLLRRMAVSRLAYLQFVTAFVSMVTGIALGGEKLGAPSLMGGACILAGLVLLARGRANEGGGPGRALTSKK